jgi:hypothetical protein
MNLLKITTLCALLLTGVVLTNNASAQKAETTKQASKMHKACAKCAKAGKKECSCPVEMKGKMASSKMHKACAKCAKSGKKECACPAEKTEKKMATKAAPKMHKACAMCAEHGMKECAH